jgi:membrane-bound lytic murein transglycosylase D
MPQPAGAQSLWRLDSLAATWPVRAALEASHRQSAPGVVRAMDTRDLLPRLRAASPELPVFADTLVARYVDLLGEPRRDELRAALGLCEEYAPLIEGELVRHGLPRQLRYLPLGLSAMNTLAESPEGGAGLWMLTYPVALRYGLRVTADIDERRDPRLSTAAAARHLKDLHARYGDWGMAIMAFACGPANITRAQGRSTGSTAMEALYPHFTAGCRDALPLWMAFTYLAEHAGKLGIAPIHAVPFEPADTIRAATELRISTVSAILQLPKERLQALNSTLCNDRVPAFHALLLPKGEGARFTALGDSVRRAQEALNEAVRKASEPGEDLVARAPDGREAIYYRVRSGDYLGRIAQRFGVKVSQLRTWNRLRGDHIDVGEDLVIYVTPAQRARYERQQEQPVADDPPAEPRPAPPAGVAPAQGFTWYTVKRGDSLYGIAKRYPGVDADSLMRINGIGADIRPGQRLKVPLKP